MLGVPFLCDVGDDARARSASSSWPTTYLDRATERQPGVPRPGASRRRSCSTPASGILGDLDAGPRAHAARRRGGGSSSSPPTPLARQGDLDAARAAAPTTPAASSSRSGSATSRRSARAARTSSCRRRCSERRRRPPAPSAAAAPAPATRRRSPAASSWASRSPSHDGDAVTRRPAGQPAAPRRRARRQRRLGHDRPAQRRAVARRRRRARAGPGCATCCCGCAAPSATSSCAPAPGCAWRRAWPATSTTSSAWPPTPWPRPAADPELAGELAADAVADGDAPVFVDFEYDEWAVTARRERRAAADQPARPAVGAGRGRRRPARRPRRSPSGRCASTATPTRGTCASPSCSRCRTGSPRRSPCSTTPPRWPGRSATRRRARRSAAATICSVGRQRVCSGRRPPTLRASEQRGPSLRSGRRSRATMGAILTGPMTTRRARVLMRRMMLVDASNARPTTRRRTPSHGAVTAGCASAHMTLIYAPSTVGPSSRPPDVAPAPAAATIVGDDGRSSPCERAVVALGSSSAGRSMARRWSAPVTCAGRPWWIPASAVWSDADADGTPQHPRPIGLAQPAAAGRSPCSPASATASAGRPTLARRPGRELPVVDGPRRCGRTTDTVVYDGRLGHDVPTVVVVSDRAVVLGRRSDARGGVPPGAVRRPRRARRSPASWSKLGSRLGPAPGSRSSPSTWHPGDAAPASHRLSVQLVLAPSHEPGRPWDADPVN